MRYAQMPVRIKGDFQTIRMSDFSIDGEGITVGERCANTERDIAAFEAGFEAIWHQAMTENERELMAELHRLERIRDQIIGKRLRLAYTLKIIDSFGYFLVLMFSALRRLILQRCLDKPRFFVIHYPKITILMAAVTGVILTSSLGLGPVKFHFENITGRAPTVADEPAPDGTGLANQIALVRGESNNRAIIVASDLSLGLTDGAERLHPAQTQAARGNGSLPILVPSSAQTLLPCSNRRCVTLEIQALPASNADEGGGGGWSVSFLALPSSLFRTLDLQGGPSIDASASNLTVARLIVAPPTSSAEMPSAP